MIAPEKWGTNISHVEPPNASCGDRQEESVYEDPSFDKLVRRVFERRLVASIARTVGEI